MNLKLTTIVAVGVIVLAIVWVLVSPLFIDDVVDEALPVAQNTLADNEAVAEPVQVESEDDAVADNSDVLTLPEKDDEVLVVEEVNTQGSTFVNGDRFHKASGIVTIHNIDGEQLLRFEDFSATNGPDLYVYLATDESASEYVSLGKLKGNVGNQNYEIPAGTDLETYDTALIWCQAFGVLFGSADLS